MVFAPFGGFADSTPIENSYVRLPDAPGVGFEEKSKLMDLFRFLFS
jgi:L-alanine-DL-glutamate epimerase-like enolase superfamily enzyme